MIPARSSNALLKTQLGAPLTACGQQPSLKPSDMRNAMVSLLRSFAPPLAQQLIGARAAGAQPDIQLSFPPAQERRDVIGDLSGTQPPIPMLHDVGRRECIDTSLKRDNVSSPGAAAPLAIADAVADVTNDAKGSPAKGTASLDIDAMIERSNVAKKTRKSILKKPSAKPNTPNSDNKSRPSMYDDFPLEYLGCKIYAVEGRWRVVPRPGKSPLDKGFSYRTRPKAEVWDDVCEYCEHPVIPRESANYVQCQLICVSYRTRVMAACFM